jgi:FOG: HPt domain
MTDTPTITGFNVPLALRQLGGNMKLYTKLLDKFEKSYAGAPQELSGYIAASDYETAERTAHTIKGLAGSLGATSLQEASAALEKKCRDKTPAAEIQDTLSAFAGELEAAINAIRVFLAEQVASAPAAPASSAVNKGLLASQLATLAHHADENDARSLMAFEEMRTHLEAFDAAAAKKIASALEMFEFSDVIDVINSLKSRL